MFVELKAEIDRLRSQSGVMNEEQQSASLAEITALKEKLAYREKEMEEMTRYGTGLPVYIYVKKWDFFFLELPIIWDTGNWKSLSLNLKILVRETEAFWGEKSRRGQAIRGLFLFSQYHQLIA